MKRECRVELRMVGVNFMKYRCTPITDDMTGHILMY